MLYLIGAILFSSWLTIAFKISDRLRISTFQAIIFNYFTCVFTGIVVEGSSPSLQSITQAVWLPWAIIMGLMFVSIFNLVAYTTRKSGLAITSVANKLSLVIPFISSFFLFNEALTYFKVAGVLLALLAVYFTCFPSPSSQDASGSSGINKTFLLLPFVLFIGSGLQDTLIKYVETNFIFPSNENIYIMTAFGTAGFTGLLVFLWKIYKGKERFDLRSVAAGIVIGVPNYFSLWCLMRVLKRYPGNSSSIIPIANMGIVLFSTLIAALVFNERLSRMNLIGIILSLIAISMIAFG